VDGAQVVGPLLPLTFLLYAPGAALVRFVLRRPTLEALVVAPAVSVFLLGVLGGIVGVLGLPASTVAILVGVLLLVAGSVGVGVVRGSFPYATSPDLVRWSITLAGAAAGALVAAVAWGSPARWVAAPPQSWDYLWHQYVVATMQRRGLMGPQNLVPVDGYSDLTTYYQHGAHLIAGSVPGQGMGAVSAGLNLTLWVASVLVLPLGMAALAGAFQAKPVVIVAAPLAASIAPDLVFGQFGLWAFAVALCATPGVIYAGVVFVRTRALSSAATVVLSLAGLFLTHPHAYLIASIAMGAALLLLPDRGTPSHGPLPDRSVPIALMLLGALGVALTLPWYVLASEVQTFSTALQLRDPPVDDAGAVLRQMLLGQRVGGGGPESANVLLGVTTWAAAVLLAVRRRHVAVLLAWVVLVGMTAVTAGGSGSLRMVLGGLWLGDWYRPAAGYALIGALVLALGIDELVTALSYDDDHRSSLGQLAGTLAFASLIIAIGLRIPDARGDVARLFGPWLDPVAVEDLAYSQRDGPAVVIPSGQAPIFGPGQAEALAVLADITPHGSRVMNWWPDGSPWMYGAYGLVPVQTYAITSVNWDDAVFVQRHLHDIERYDEVVDALARLEVCSAFAAEGHLDAGSRPAWTRLEELPGFVLVQQDAHARVFQVQDPRLRAGCPE